MIETVIGARTFLMDDQWAFGRASGDLNPVHVDPEYARRTMFGDVLVHGVHTLMWALDRYLADGGDTPVTLRAQFAKPVFLGELVTLSRVEEEGTTILTLLSDGVSLVNANMGPSRWPNVPVHPETRGSWSSEPRFLRHDELTAREADLPFDINPASLRPMFPALSAAFGDKATGTLALLSRLVGMECPGKQSLFSGLSLRLDRDNSRESFAYRVRRSAPAFAPVEMDFAGPDLAGTVSAFFRPSEVSQPKIADVAERVHPGEFSAQRALIVGGSRGLGELTAKLLVAGGAEVVITYVVGASDAERVQKEIQAHGGSCRVQRLNVLDPGESMRAIFAGTGRIDAAYYFATPRITGRRKAAFESDKLLAFEKYYVHAFADFCLALSDLSPKPVTILYPSTVFVDDPSPDNVEYAMAKSAGEVLGAALTAAGAVRVVSRRLPKMATDQTSGILRVEVKDSVKVLLESIRAVNAAGSIP